MVNVFIFHPITIPIRKEDSRGSKQTLPKTYDCDISNHLVWNRCIVLNTTKTLILSEPERGGGGGVDPPLLWFFLSITSLLKNYWPFKLCDFHFFTRHMQTLLPYTALNRNTCDLVKTAKVIFETLEGNPYEWLKT